MSRRDVGLLAALGAFLGGRQPTDGKKRERELTPVEKAREADRRVRSRAPAGRTYLFGVRINKRKLDEQGRRDLAKHLTTMACAKGSQAVHRARRDAERRRAT